MLSGTQQSHDNNQTQFTIQQNGKEPLTLVLEELLHDSNMHYIFFSNEKDLDNYTSKSEYVKLRDDELKLYIVAYRKINENKNRTLTKELKEHVENDSNLKAILVFNACINCLLGLSAQELQYNRNAAKFDNLSLDQMKELVIANSTKTVEESSYHRIFKTTNTVVDLHYTRDKNKNIEFIYFIIYSPGLRSDSRICINISSKRIKNICGDSKVCNIIMKHALKYLDSCMQNLETADSLLKAIVHPMFSTDVAIRSIFHTYISDNDKDNFSAPKIISSCMENTSIQSLLKHTENKIEIEDSNIYKDLTEQASLSSRSKTPWDYIIMLFIPFKVISIMYHAVYVKIFRSNIIT